MTLDLSWLKEENWATDLFADVVKGWLAPKPGEVEPVSPQVGEVGYKMEFGDWVLPVTAIGVVGVVVLVLWLAIKT